LYTRFNSNEQEKNTRLYFRELKDAENSVIKQYIMITCELPSWTK